METMTREEKEFLLKDICARLPYGVKVESIFINPDTKEHKSCGIEVFDATSILMIRDGLGEFKPYLFPLSSMTEEERITIGNEFAYGQPHKAMDILHQSHIDYKGLIPMGLAIDATGKNIY